jgi:hypothetical protein
MVFQDLDCIHLAQDRVQDVGSYEHAMKILVP